LRLSLDILRPSRKNFGLMLRLVHDRFLWNSCQFFIHQLS